MAAGPANTLLQREDSFNKRREAYKAKRSRAFALLHNLVKDDHKDIAAANNRPWTLYTALLTKFRYDPAHRVQAASNIQAHFYTLKMPDDTSIDTLEAEVTKFIAALEMDQTSANLLVANTIVEVQVINHFKTNCSILKSFIVQRCMQNPAATFAVICSWVQDLFSETIDRATLINILGVKDGPSTSLGKRINNSQANSAETVLADDDEDESSSRKKRCRKRIPKSQANVAQQPSNNQNNNNNNNNNNRNNNNHGGKGRGRSNGHQGRGHGNNDRYQGNNNQNSSQSYGYNHDYNQGRSYNNQRGGRGHGRGQGRGGQGRGGRYFYQPRTYYPQSQNFFQQPQAHLLHPVPMYEVPPVSGPAASTRSSSHVTFEDLNNYSNFVGSFHSFSATTPFDAIIVDSGSCNNHVKSLSHVSDYRPGRNVIEVQTASGDQRTTQGTGFIGALEVHYTPEFAAELLSVSSLVDLQHSVLFDGNEVIITHKITGERFVGTRVGQLYYIPKSILTRIKLVTSYRSEEPHIQQLVARNQPSDQPALIASTQPRSNFITWHARTHQSFDHLLKLSREAKVLNFSLRNSGFEKRLSNCIACSHAKIRRKSYKKVSVIRVNDILIYFFTDVKGPIHPQGINHEIYVVVFIDAYSKFKWVYIIKSKDAVAEAFLKFLEDVIRPLRRPVSANQGPITFCQIVSDGGGEYEGRFDQLCRDHGYLHKTTPPYTPELNGLSENYWRTLFGTVRAFIFQNENSVPLNLWPYAVKYANQILNRTLLTPRNGEVKTPYEWLYQELPDVSSLRVFGCECFVYIPKGLRSNTSLGSHSVRGRFLGFTDKGLRTALVMSYENRAIKLFNTDFGNVLFNEVIEPRRLIDNGQVVIASDNGRVDLTSPDFVLLQNESIDEQFQKRQKNQSEEIPLAVPAPDPVPRSSDRLKAKKNGQALVVKKKAKDTVTLDEALKGPHREAWQKSILQELYSIVANHVWDIVVRPPFVRLLMVMYVLRQKLDLFGQVERLKTRLVVIGSGAVPGVDYDETYAPVSKISSFRIFFSIVVQFSMFLFQLDFDTAFLNADIDNEDIYLYPPPFIELLYPGVDWARYCLKLNKALYGLPQAPLLWFRHIDRFLKSLGYVPLSTEPCFYRIDRPGYTAFLVLYVDDMVMACTSQEELHLLVQTIKKSFKIKELGVPTHLLGLRVNYNREAGFVQLDATHKIDRLIEKMNMSNCRFEQLPMNPSIKLSAKPVKPDGSYYPDTLSADQKSLYRSIVGAVMFIMLTTRPDIAFTVTTLARFLSDPLDMHLDAAKHLLRYLRFTREYALEYRRVSWKDYKVRAYSDSDWGANLDTRRSHTGGVIFLGTHMIIWTSNVQPTVSLSSAQAEINALKEVVKLVLWVRRLLEELNIFQAPLPPVDVFEDNQAALQIAINPEVSKRNRHFDMSYHFIRENIEEFKTINLLWIDSLSNWADLFTKAMTFDAFYRFIRILFHRFVRV